MSGKLKDIWWDFKVASCWRGTKVHLKMHLIGFGKIPKVVNKSGRWKVQKMAVTTRPRKNEIEKKNFF